MDVKTLGVHGRVRRRGRQDRPGRAGDGGDPAGRRSVRRRVVPTVLAAVLAVPATLAVTTASQAEPADQGLWGPVLDWGLQGKHMAALPTGKVLVWSTGANARVWDPASDAFVDTPALFGDLHCAGNAQLADGRVVVLGGQDGGTHIGTKVTALFDATTRTWTEGAPMTYARWYASVTTLADGRVLSTSGDDAQGRRISTPEVYDPATNRWTELTGAVRTQGLYPHMYVLPNGKVYEAAPGSSTALLDLAGTGSWTAGPTNGWSTSGYSESSVMYEPGKIMRAGGGDPAIARTGVVDMTAASPAWTETAPMAFPRRRMNMTVLADGQVLAIGGTAAGDDAGRAVLPAELWNPTTRTWTTLASMAEPRMYHSAAVLMLDGRVVVGGGEAAGRLRAQIFEPPYLHKGPRPTVTSVPATAGYGTPIPVGAPDPAGVTSVALIRLGANTHAWDQNQRYVPLTFTRTATGVTATAPANGNVAPPGSYMLVVKNAAGVPSVGQVVRLGSSASLQPGRAVGRVTNAAGAAISGARVFAGAQSVTTNTTGSYTLAGLAPGEVGLTVEAAGFASAVRTVLVPPGGDVTASFTLVPPGNVTGRVTDAGTGAAVPDAVVTYPGGSVPAGTDGTYTITGAPSGPLEVTVSAIGYETRTLTVTVPANGTLPLDVPLTRSATFVTGGVADRATGTDLVGATVTLSNGATTTTDALGRYRFDVPAGTYTVTATAAGFGTASGQAVVSTGTYAVVDLLLDATSASNRLKNITFENGSLTHATTGADRVSGAVTLDTAAPVAGTASARFSGAGGYLEESFGSQDDVYAAALLKVGTLPTSDTRVVQVLNGSTTVGALQLRASGRLRLRNGSTTIGVESAPLTAGTTYRVGVHQRRGTGGNAVLEAFVAPAGAAFGAPFARTATGAWTTAATAVRLGVTTGNGTFSLDDVLLDAAAMPGGGGGPPPPPPPPPPGGALSFAPVADAQTKSTSATTNYGTDTTVRLRQGTAASPGDYRSYLRFTVSGLAPTVTSAKLRLFVTDPSAVGGSVFRTTGAWTETGVTWASQPTLTGSALATAGATSTGAWVEIDVTPAVTGNGTVELGLSTTSTDSAIYSSREGANPPQLVVTSS